MKKYYLHNNGILVPHNDIVTVFRWENITELEYNSSTNVLCICCTDSEVFVEEVEQVELYDICLKYLEYKN